MMNSMLDMLYGTAQERSLADRPVWLEIRKGLAQAADTLQSLGSSLSLRSFLKTNCRILVWKAVTKNYHKLGLTVWKLERNPESGDQQTQFLWRH